AQEHTSTSFPYTTLFRSMKRIATKVCTVVFSVAALAGCDWFRGPQNPATPVQTIHPKHGEIVRRVTLPGNVTAYQEATLYAKVRSEEHTSELQSRENLVC